MSTKRIKLADRILPSYTKGEEIFNMVSHIVGAVLGVITIILTSVFAAINNVKLGVISGVIMGVTLLVLYTISSVYHGLSPKLTVKKIFQIIDHCSIFLLIAHSTASNPSVSIKIRFNGTFLATSLTASSFSIDGPMVKKQSN